MGGMEQTQAIRAAQPAQQADEEEHSRPTAASNRRSAEEIASEWQ